MRWLVPYLIIGLAYGHIVAENRKEHEWAGNMIAGAILWFPAMIESAARSTAITLDQK